MTSFLQDLKRELEGRKGRLREFYSSSPTRPGFISVREREVLDFVSWDYLGLVSDRRTRRAAQECLEQGVLSTSSPRTSVGTHQEHRAMEMRLSQFLSTESAVVLSSKNQAVFSLVTALGGERDAFIFDESTSSPVGDAAFLVNASCSPYRMGDLDSLTVELERTKSARRRFIFVESLSSVTGQIADMANIVLLAKKHDADIILDESFAVGAVGILGAGNFDSLRRDDAGAILCCICDLSLGLGAYGAAVAGPAAVITHIIDCSKTLANETSLPPAICSAVLKSIDLTEVSAGARSNIQCLSDSFFRSLIGIIPNVGKWSGSPVASLPFPKLSIATEVCTALLQKGFACEVVSPRLLRSELSFVRFIFKSAHTSRNIDDLSTALHAIIKKLQKGS